MYTRIRLRSVVLSGCRSLHALPLLLGATSTGPRDMRAHGRCVQCGYFASARSQASAATTIASTPVCSVGCNTGAVVDRQLVQRAGCFRFGVQRASVPPTKQYTDGACYAEP